jgi:hypothetical protein
MRVAVDPDVEVLSLRSFRDQLRAWLSGESPLESRSVKCALIVALILLVPVGPPRPEAVAVLLVLGLLLAVSLRYRVGPLVLLGLLIAGIWMRIATYEAGGSDVLDATVAAINRALAGGNPYVAPAPGHPFVYGPVALVWYLPFKPDLVQVEFAISIALLGALTISGRALGLAVYAVMPTLYFTASDGSNDTSAGFLILLALVILRRSLVGGGFALAIAASFKLYAAAWLPALVMWAGLAGAAGFALGTAVIWIPAALLWGFGPIVASLVLAEGAHGGSFFSLAQAIEGITHQKVSQTTFDRLKLFVGGGVALLTAPLIRTWQHLVVAGMIVYAATLFTGYWATTAYLAGLAPLICWHLDEWLGLSRLRWPDDPWARISRWLDSRWPPLVAPTAVDSASS